MIQDRENCAKLHTSPHKPKPSNLHIKKRKKVEASYMQQWSDFVRRIDKHSQPTYSQINSTPKASHVPLSCTQTQRLRSCSNPRPRLAWKISDEAMQKSKKLMSSSFFLTGSPRPMKEEKKATRQRGGGGETAAVFSLLVNVVGRPGRKVKRCAFGIRMCACVCGTCTCTVYVLWVWRKSGIADCHFSLGVCCVTWGKGS